MIGGNGSRRAVVDGWTRPDPAEATTSVGKTIVVTPTSISGPRQLACRGNTRISGSRWKTLET